MKLGIIARGENRGLGNLTWEACRHLHPEAILLIDMGNLDRGFASHPERYDGLAPRVQTVAFDGHLLPAAEVRQWLAGLDLVYTAETLYDWRVAEWARDAGARTVVHVMPEFYRHARQPELSAPDVWWAPTPWRLAELPPGTRLVPFPVATERFGEPGPRYRDGELLRVLHPAGKFALGDRNGTRTLLTALRRVRRPMEVTVLSQDGQVPVQRQVGRHVHLVVQKGDRPAYWDGYAGHHLCVIPRSYGGLCLPAQEAAAAGLALLMTDCEPNRSFYPADLIDAREVGAANMPCGPVRLNRADPAALTALLDGANEDSLGTAAWRSFAWAESHSWPALRDLWEHELALAAFGPELGRIVDPRD